MPQSFASLNEHIIFSTKRRQRWIGTDIEDRLYGIAGGTMNTVRGCLLAAGGTADHVHLLVSRPRDISTSDVVRDIKVATSRWMHDEINMPQFAWQTGYGAFSVSYSGIDAVKSYLARQKQHHERVTFQDEFREFLRIHQIEHDEVHMWD